MFGRLVLLFTVVPFVELALLIWIGRRIGTLPTLALIVATGVLGAALARHQGLATWSRFQRALAEGRLPGTELVEGLMILIAGAVLLTPGVLTDLAGFTLLTPPARRLLIRWARPRLRSRISIRTGGAPAEPRQPPGAAPAGAAAGDDVIDAEYEVLDRPPR